MNKQDLKNIVIEVWSITSSEEHLLDEILNKYSDEDLDEKYDVILNELNNAIELYIFKK